MAEETEGGQQGQRPGDGTQAAGTGAQQQPPHRPESGQQHGAQGTRPSDGFLHRDDVNRIVEERLAREREQYRTKLAELGIKDLDEVAKLKKQLAEREKQELEENEKWRDLAEKIRAEKDEEIRKREQELAETRRAYLNAQAERAIVAAATKHEAVAPEQLGLLVRDRIRIDDNGNPYVVDNQGNRRTNGKGGELTIDEYVKEFLTENPHFQRAARGQGAGGRPAGGNPPPSPGDIDINRAKRDIDYALQHQDEIERRIKAGEYTA